MQEVRGRSEEMQVKDDKNMDWMYKAASVNREDYLLGRSVDKAFNQLDSSAGAKVEEDKEPLPSSIFTNSSVITQVDIARKVQEDPLFAIKKKEIETREQLLKNPRKLKQLQEMIQREKIQVEKKHKKKKKHKNDLDKLLALKFKNLKDKLGLKDLKQIDTSDSEDESDDKHIRKRKSNLGHNNFKNKKKSDSSDTENTSDNEIDKKYKKRKPSSKERRSKSSEFNSRNKYSKSKTYKFLEPKIEHDRSGSNNQSRRREDDRHAVNHKEITSKSKYSKDSKRYSHCYLNDNRLRDSTKSSSKDKQTPKKHNKSSSPTLSSDSSDEQVKTKKRNKDYNREDVNTKKKTVKSNVRVKKEKFTNNSSSSTSSSTESSDDEGSSRRKKKAYGLVLPVGYVPKAKTTEKEIMKPKVEEKNPWKKPKSTNLSKEDMEKRLAEMTQNASWREKERENKIKEYKKLDEKMEKKDNSTYSKDFLRKQMLYAASQSTVEQRVKSNINNVQRSKDMDKNFARR